MVIKIPLTKLPVLFGFLFYIYRSDQIKVCYLCSIFITYKEYMIQWYIYFKILTKVVIFRIIIPFIIQCDILSLMNWNHQNSCSNTSKCTWTSVSNLLQFRWFEGLYNKKKNLFQFESLRVELRCFWSMNNRMLVLRLFAILSHLKIQFFAVFYWNKRHVYQLEWLRVESWCSWSMNQRMLVLRLYAVLIQ